GLRQSFDHADREILEVEQLQFDNHVGTPCSMESCCAAMSINCLHQTDARHPRKKGSAGRQASGRLPRGAVASLARAVKRR
ncbi:MAG TPA: hypothetical protein VGD08_19070, partial [Stellaceae bacterium]